MKILKKAPKRKYSIKFVSENKKLVEEIINDILKIESSDEIIKKLNSLKYEIYSFLITETMATFNLELCFKVIPEFKGNHDDLTPFLKTIEFIHNSLKESDRPTLIDFVRSIKLSSTVKTAISTVVCNSYESLVTTLTNRYKSKKTLIQIQNKLCNFQQRSDSVKVFSDKILKLIDELNELQIKELHLNTEVDIGRIKQLNDMYALNVFKQGLNETLVNTVFAAQPKTFAEAINIAEDMESQVKNQVMFFRQNPHNQNMGNNYNRRQNSSNFNNSRLSNYKKNNNYSTQSQFNRGNNNWNNSDRNNWNNSNNSNRNNSNPSNRNNWNNSNNSNRNNSNSSNRNNWNNSNNPNRNNSSAGNRNNNSNNRNNSNSNYRNNENRNGQRNVNVVQENLQSPEGTQATQN